MIGEAEKRADDHAVGQVYAWSVSLVSFAYPGDGTRVMACDLGFLGPCSIDLLADGRAVHGMLT
jgi:hypothetical protein